MFFNNTKLHQWVLLFTRGKTIVKTYTITAREPSIYLLRVLRKYDASVMWVNHISKISKYVSMSTGLYLSIMNLWIVGVFRIFDKTEKLLSVNFTLFFWRHWSCMTYNSILTPPQTVLGFWTSLSMSLILYTSPIS